MLSKRNLFILFIALLTAANFFLWKEVLIWDGRLHFTIFDIGQGDALFFETPRGHQILIDGGPSLDRISEKVAQRLPFWDRSLDLVVLTHPDYDHLSGLVGILGRYKVENILWTGAQRTTNIFRDWQKAITEEQANIVLAQKGQTVRADNLVFQILRPEKPLQGRVFKKATNDTCIVAAALYGANSFLLTGDITSKVEKNLLSEPLIKARVLKVAHHGSKSSSMPQFLEAVSPEIGVISVGRDNPYNHPHPRTLQNLKKFGIKVLRTDLRGDIEITSDGQVLFFP